MSAPIPPAPPYASLPAASPRLRRGGPRVIPIRVQVQVVTPILGGGSERRALDDVETIRAASLRGQLRFWWRALFSQRYASGRELLAAESERWGCAAMDQRRSAIDLRIELDAAGPIDREEVQLREGPRATPGAYALWPARAEPRKGVPTAPRRLPGTRFTLALVAPKDLEPELRDTLRAWLLFGGYGSRSRRGLGSFGVVNDPSAWLPGRPTREALTTLFARDVLAAPGVPDGDTPRLGGATLHVGATPERDAGAAWMKALGWLREFRQGTSGGPGHRARNPPPTDEKPPRPSISNWPEADKIRRLTGKTKAHPPRHDATPAWPRSGFGLPINGQFQTKARHGGPDLQEPGDFELWWRANGETHDRLASPLILKALPLADGSFVPCALWLSRAYPAGGEVGLARKQPGMKDIDSRSAAPFDRLLGPSDTARFSALQGKARLRDAFLDWLRTTQSTKVIAP